jgi:hypothetical protein
MKSLSNDLEFDVAHENDATVFIYLGAILQPWVVVADNIPSMKNNIEEKLENHGWEVEPDGLYKEDRDGQIIEGSVSFVIHKIVPMSAAEEAAWNAAMKL